MSTVETRRSNNTGDTLGTGRRKTSVARVRVRAGKGTIAVNGRAFEHFFVREQDRHAVLAPLVQTDRVGRVDVSITVHGGGITGQAGACKLGIARALKSLRQRALKSRCGRRTC